MRTAMHVKTKQVLGKALILSCVLALLGVSYWIYSSTVLADKKESDDTQVINIFPGKATYSAQWESVENLSTQYLGQDASFAEFNQNNSAHIKLPNNNFVLASQIEETSTTSSPPQQDEDNMEEEATSTEGTSTTTDLTSDSESSEVSTSTEETSTSTSTTTDSSGESGASESPTSTEGDSSTTTSSSSESGAGEATTSTEEDSFCLREEGDCLVEQLEVSDFEFDKESFQDNDIISTQLRVSLAARPTDENGDYVSSTEKGDKVVVEYFYDEKWTEAGEINITEIISNQTNGGYFLYALPALDNIEDLNGISARFTYMSRQDIPAAEVYMDSVWVEIETLPDPSDEVLEPDGENDGVDSFKISALEDNNSTSTEEGVEDGNSESDAQTLTSPGFLKKPVLHKVISPENSNISFDLADNPQFSLRYDPQKSASSSATTSISTGGEFAIHDAEVVSIKGRKANVQAEINYTGDDSWEVKIVPKGDIAPGKYTLRFKTEEGGEVYDDELQFYWGVLAINTNKAVFVSRETAHVQAAVLNDVGDTICDASVQLEITDPSGRSEDVPVILSGECDGNNYAEVPDYFSYYETDEVGEYNMRFVRLDEEGKEHYSIEDSFYVENAPLFEVERVGPTRINPIFGYNMQASVKASEDFAGEIVESVPESFEIRNPGSEFLHEFEVRDSEDSGRKEIVWNVEMKKGDVLELAYQFDAPNVSPEFYLLGPLRFKSNDNSVTLSGSEGSQGSSARPQNDAQSSSLTEVFEENRQWQIASDQASQFSRPDADISTGLWTPTPLFEEINETTRDDSDFIYSDNHSTEIAEIGMSNIEDPGTDSDHFFRYTYRKESSGGFSIDFRIRLMDGATEVASFTHTGVSASFQEAEQELTPAQVANISDYSNLEITLECLRGGSLCSGGRPPDRRGVDVSWAELEAPVPASEDPPTMDTHNPVNITETGASASGTIVTTGGGTVIERGFVWSTDSTSTPSTSTSPENSGYESNTFQTGSFATGTYSLSMSSLEAGTTYYYRSYAENSAGYGYGDEVQFQTQIAVPTVETNDADNIGPDSADGHGDVTNTGGQSEDITERGFVWATTSQSDPGDTSPTSSNYSFFTSATGTFATGTFSLQLDNLDTDTTYLYRAYARNSQGYSYGEEKEFTTLGDLPAVSTLSAQNIDQTSASGRGEIDDIGANNPTERGFVWATSSQSNPGNNSPTSSSYASSTSEAGSFGTGIFSLSITSLDPDTTYYYRAYAFNSEGYSYGSEVEFTTLDRLPEITTNSATDIRTRSATGAGEVTDDGGLEITERGFVWDTVSRGEPASTTAPANSDYGSFASSTGSFGIGSFSLPMTQLHFETQYYYRAYALNSEGYKYGNQLSFTTENAQFSRPDSTNDPGGWTPTPLHERINSEAIDFGEPIISDDNTSPDTANLGMSTISTPADDTDHFFRYVFKKDQDGGHVIDFTIRLLHNGTLIDEWVHTGIVDSFTYAEQALSEAQAANITDYSLLTVELVREGDTGGPDRRSAEAYWVEFEAPEATEFDPPTVTVSPASNIDMFEAQGNGNVTDDGNSSILSRGFAWATTSQALPASTTDPNSSGYSNWATTTAGTGSYNLLMQSLEAGTQYFYRAFAENSEGWGWSSSEESFTTLPTTPLVDTNAADAGATSATGTGDITHLGNSTTTERGFVWSTSSQADPGNVSPENSGYAASTTETDLNGFTTGIYQLILDNLDPDVQYFYRAYAANSDGYAYGDEVSFTTGGALPSLTTFSPPDPIGPETATGTADLSSLGASDVTERGFVWTTSTQADPGDTDPASSAYDQSTNETNAGGFSTGIYQLEIAGLEELTTYYYRAYAKNSDGYAYGNEIEFETVSNLAEVSTLTPQNVAATTTDGRGDITSTGLGDVTERGFVWDKTSHSQPISTTTPENTAYPDNTGETDANGFSTGEYTLLLDSLTEGSVYYYRAYVLNDEGYTYGNEISFTTDSTRPTLETRDPTSVGENSVTGEGTIVDTDVTTSTSRGFVWATSSQSHPGDIGPGSSGYDNNISESGDFNPGDYSINLTGLSPGTTYFYRSFAENSEGYNYGNEIEFETQAAPVISNVTLNSGSDIALIEGTTTEVLIEAEVTDLNGWEDLNVSSATSVAYRSGVGDNCSADDNNCYVVTDCSITQTGTTTADLACTADMQYFAEPTDTGSPHEAEDWQAKISICDSGGLCDEDFASGVELFTLLAISSTQLIDYGTMEPGDDTGSTNQTTTFTNTGNIAFGVEVEGTAMIGPDTIAVGNQKFNTDPFTYSATGTPLSDTAQPSGVTLAKATSTTPVDDDLYWGLGIGAGFPGGSYTGENIFSADP